MRNGSCVFNCPTFDGKPARCAEASVNCRYNTNSKKCAFKARTGTTQSPSQIKLPNCSNRTFSDCNNRCLWSIKKKTCGYNCEKFSGQPALCSAASADCQLKSKRNQAPQKIKGQAKMATRNRGKVIVVMRKRGRVKMVMRKRGKAKMRLRKKVQPKMRQRRRGGSNKILQKTLRRLAANRRLRNKKLANEKRSNMNKGVKKQNICEFKPSGTPAGTCKGNKSTCNSLELCIWRKNTCQHNCPKYNGQPTLCKRAKRNCKVTTRDGKENMCVFGQTTNSMTSLPIRGMTSRPVRGMTSQPVRGMTSRPVRGGLPGCSEKLKFQCKDTCTWRQKACQHNCPRYNGAANNCKAASADCVYKQNLCTFKDAGATNPGPTKAPITSQAVKCGGDKARCDGLDSCTWRKNTCQYNCKLYNGRPRKCQRWKRDCKVGKKDKCSFIS